MAKKATLSSVSSGYNSASTINADISAVNDKLDNTLSLDGSTPNAMGANLDMNSNDITNVGTVTTSALTVAGQNLVSATAVPDWEGAWVTATAYAVNDLVQESGNTYICLVAHTSGTFATDLAAAKWELFASKGASGGGSGDLVSTNNLSDLDNADTALTNLGGGTVGIAIFKDTNAAAVQTELSLVPGTDVQAYNASLADIAGITGVAGDILYHNGSNWVDLPKGTASQTLAMNSGATAPEWVTPSGSQVVLISKQTASTVATIDFTSLSGYSKYLLVLENVLSAGNNEQAYLRMSAASTFLTGTDYEYNTSNDYIGGSSLSNESATGTNFPLTPGYPNGGDTGEYGISGSFWFYGMNNTAVPTTMRGEYTYWYSSASQFAWGEIKANLDRLEANDGIRFYFDSGNIESGTLTLYGIKDT